YNIYRDGVLIATTVGTSYSDVNLNPGTTYTYEISAVDLAGNEGLKSTSVSATTDQVADYTTVLISEVYYDAIGSDSKGEWLELYNYGSFEVDLSGWILTDNLASWTIPDGTIIQPGEYLVIARSASGFYKLYGFYPDVAGLSLFLGNRGDQLILKDNSGIEIDFVAWENYVSGWDIYCVTGSSLARKDVTTDTDTVNDWVVVYNEGTPGGP
ncbi:MAG: lamin tail domain-containing protein, partial [Candidatus Hodarchaeales archaeon]